MTDTVTSFMKGIPMPPEGSVELYVEMEECDLHFLDAVIKVYDGVANVRREYRVIDEEKQFLVYTSPGLLDFTVNAIRSLRKYIYIGKIVIGNDTNES